MVLTPEQQAEIDSQRSSSARTHRVCSSGMERMLYIAQPVLDHGFVRVVDYMGDDSAVVQAARVSYGTGTKKTRSDAALIRFLMRHRHTTPFEMCEIKLHVKLPIFVARQWIRHRTASVNEYSARYSKLDREFYVPASDDLAAQSGSSGRQGRGHTLDAREAAHVLETMKHDNALAYGHYEEMLSTHGKSGVAREIARICLPSSIYTQWYWKIDLHNLLHFIKLRSDRHAQLEIQMYAKALGKLVAAWVPTVWKAFEDYGLNAASLSHAQIQLVKRKLAGESVDMEESGLTAREWREFRDVFEL
ncbi:MAG: FAD-dependent thymidylate synthase [Rhodobacteraceae bacterium]|nr:FAD-dependent thymidylate synthase [Paracoccaceae bacterium]